MPDLHFTEIFNEAPNIIYAALTQPALLNLWLSNTNRINARVGGNYLLSWNGGYFAAGEFTALEPDHKIAMTWLGKHEPGMTEVNITLTPADGGGTQLDLIHGGFGEDSQWAASVTNLQEGWQTALGDLRYLVETGLDGRVMRRPMMGVYPAFVNDELRARLNLPVDVGMLLTGVLPGMGAEKAGLRSGDVLIVLNGQPYGTGGKYTAIVSTLKVGQVVELEYLRDGEKQTAKLELSARAAPEIPATVADLAVKMDEANQTALRELRELLKDVPENLLTPQPEPGEWSVNEVLAHLVWTEHHWHIVMWAGYSGEDYVPWPANDALQLAKALAVYPTSRDLLAELERAMTSSIAMVRAMSATFPENRASYVTIATGWNSSLLHIQSHYEQIKHAIEAAKTKAAIAEPVAG